MPLPYKQNKQHIYKWRENNLEHRRELERNWARKKYAWKKVQKEFLMILLDEL
jgi:hypothetical protein